MLVPKIKKKETKFSSLDMYEAVLLIIFLSVNRCLIIICNDKDLSMKFSISGCN